MSLNPVQVILARVDKIASYKTFVYYGSRLVRLFDRDARTALLSLLCHERPPNRKIYIMDRAEYLVLLQSAVRLALCHWPACPGATVHCLRNGYGWVIAPTLLPPRSMLLETKKKKKRYDSTSHYTGVPVECCGSRHCSPFLGVPFRHILPNIGSSRIGPLLVDCQRNSIRDYTMEAYKLLFRFSL